MQFTSKNMSSEMQDCINNCANCHAICIETISHCLQMGGKHADPAHIKLLMDCVQICETSEDFMLRMSQFHPQVCGTCADICEACAESCEALSEDSGDIMARCVEWCRTCAASCRKMESSSASSASM